MRLIKSRAPGKIRVKADRSISFSLLLAHPRRYHALSFPSALRCPSFLSLSLSAYNSDMNGKKRKKKERSRIPLQRRKKKNWRWGDGEEWRRASLFSRHRGARLLHAKMPVSPNDCSPSLLPFPPPALDDEGNSVVTISHWFGIRRAILTTRAYIRFVKRTITEFGPVILCIRLAMPV